MVVDSRDLKALEEQIMTLINSPTLRQLLGQRARAVALEKHNFEHTRSRFRELLAQTAASRPSSFSNHAATFLTAAKVTLAPRRLAGRLPEQVKGTIKIALGRGSKPSVK